MALTQEEKEFYALFINQVYDGALNVSANDITPEVVEVVDGMFLAIRECSKAMASTHAVYSAFYGNAITSLSALMKALRKAAVETTKNWLKVTQENAAYRSCMKATALRWRSPLQMALMGI